jgi:hypothetical protein
VLFTGNEKIGDITIRCPFDHESHSYELIYKSKSNVIYLLTTEVVESKKKVKEQVEITRTFVCPKTKEEFKTTFPVDLTKGMDPDRIVVL